MEKRDLYRCETCLYFQPLEDYQKAGIIEELKEAGVCRINPPVATNTPTKWPIVKPAEWCGKFQIDQ